MEKTLTEEQAMKRLRERVSAAGNQVNFADEHGIHRSVLSDVLNHRRDLGTSILEAIGLERVVLYREVKK